MSFDSLCRAMTRSIFAYNMRACLSLLTACFHTLRSSSAPTPPSTTRATTTFMNLISALAVRWSLTRSEIIQHEGLSTTENTGYEFRSVETKHTRARLKAHGEYENKQTVKNRFGCWIMAFCHTLKFDRHMARMKGTKKRRKQREKKGRYSDKKTSEKWKRNRNSETKTEQKKKEKTEPTTILYTLRQQS